MQTDARAEPARPDGRRRRVGALSQSPGATEPQVDPSGQNVTVARVLLGVTGGIAAYKACELVRLLVRAGHGVVALVTPVADRFVRPGTFHALARRPSRDDPCPHPERSDLP